MKSTAMQDQLYTTGNYGKIVLNTTEGRYFFHPEEIVRLEASSHYSLYKPQAHIHCQSAGRL